MSPDRPSGPVGRSDIEAKLREIGGEVDTIERSVAPFVIAAGAAAVIAVVAAAYVLGKRKGKRKRTIVEIRRV